MTHCKTRAYGRSRSGSTRPYRGAAPSNRDRINRGGPNRHSIGVSRRSGRSTAARYARASVRCGTKGFGSNDTPSCVKQDRTPSANAPRTGAGAPATHRTRARGNVPGRSTVHAIAPSNASSMAAASSRARASGISPMNASVRCRSSAACGRADSLGRHNSMPSAASDLAAALSGQSATKQRTDQRPRFSSERRTFATSAGPW